MIPHRKHVTICSSCLVPGKCVKGTYKVPVVPAGNLSRRLEETLANPPVGTQILLDKSISISKHDKMKQRS